MTMATRASDRASGPVNVSARLLAARSHGDCANAAIGSDKSIASVTTLVRRRNATKDLPHIRDLQVVVTCLHFVQPLASR